MTAEAFVLLDALDVNSGPVSGAPAWAEVLADDFTVGEPAKNFISLASSLVDGDFGQNGHWGNRERVVPVRVSGVDLSAVDDYEKTLWLTVQSATSLTLRLPGQAANSVWDVVSASMAEKFDDLAQVLPAGGGVSRIYLLTLNVFPWPRSADKTTVSFTAAAGAVTNLDTCTATTNFTAIGGSSALAAVTYPASGGDAAVKMSATITTALVDYSYDWTGAVGSGSALLEWDYTSDVPGFAPPRMSSGGSGYDSAVDAVSVVAPSPLNANYTRYVFANPGGTPRIHARLGGYSGGSKTVLAGTANGYIANLGKGAGLPASSMYVVNVPGAMRTTATVKVTKTSSTLSPLACYWDPTMLAYGWAPNNQASWANAPAGRYQAFIVVPGAATGYQLSLTYTDAAGVADTKKTLFQAISVDPCLGVPIGIFDFRHNPSGVIGAGGVWTASKTGVPSGGTTSVTTTANLVLLRMSEGTDLLGHADYFSVNPRGADTICQASDPTMLQQFGAVATGATTATLRDATDRMPGRGAGPVTLTPGTTALWIPVGTADPFTAPSNLTVDLSFYPRFHSYVSSAA